jgi:hypothetical protein
MEPSIPSFLLGLVESQPDIPLETGVGIPSNASREAALSDIELHDDVFELDTIELTPIGEQASAISAPPAQAEMKDHLDSALKVFKDIENLNDSPGGSKGAENEAEMDFDIDFVLDDVLSSSEAAKKDVAQPSAKPRMPVGESELSLEKQGSKPSTMSATIPEANTVEFSDDDLDQLVLDDDFTQELTFEADIKDAPPAQAQNAQKVEQQGVKGLESHEEGLVLELSEDDLESLILELEDDDEKKPASSANVSSVRK